MGILIWAVSCQARRALRASTRTPRPATVSSVLCAALHDFVIVRFEFLFPLLRICVGAPSVAHASILSLLRCVTCHIVCARCGFSHSLRLQTTARPSTTAHAPAPSASRARLVPRAPPTATDPAARCVPRLLVRSWGFVVGVLFCFRCCCCCCACPLQLPNCVLTLVSLGRADHSTASPRRRATAAAAATPTAAPACARPRSAAPAARRAAPIATTTRPARYALCSGSGPVGLMAGSNFDCSSP